MNANETKTAPAMPAAGGSPRRKPAVFRVEAPAVVAEIQIDGATVPVSAPSAGIFSRVVSLWGKRDEIDRGEGGAGAGGAAASLALLIEAVALLVPALERARIEAMPVEALARLVEFLLEEIGRDATSREVAVTRDPFPPSPSPSGGTGDSIPTK